MAGAVWNNMIVTANNALEKMEDHWESMEYNLVATRFTRLVAAVTNRPNYAR